MSNPILAQAMAIFTNLAIGLLIRQGRHYLPQARRYCNANPQATLASLLHPPG